MSLSIYSSANSTTPLSQAGAFTNPFAISFDGRVGGYKESKLYVRNDSSLFYYTGLTLTLDDQTVENVTTATTDGFSWKLFSGDTKPTLNDWINITPSNTITLSDIGASGDPDSSTYLPFWVYVKVPSNLSVQVFTGVKFLLTGNEVLV